MCFDSLHPRVSNFNSNCWQSWCLMPKLCLTCRHGISLTSACILMYYHCSRPGYSCCFPMHYYVVGVLVYVEWQCTVWSFALDFKKVLTSSISIWPCWSNAAPCHQQKRKKDPFRGSSGTLVPYFWATDKTVHHIYSYKYLNSKIGYHIQIISNCFTTSSMIKSPWDPFGLNFPTGFKY